MKKIIIIGGTGFLGFHLARYCLKKNFKVISFSRNRPKKNRYLKKVLYLLGDIGKKNKFKLDLKKHLDADYIVNFGGDVEHRNLKKIFLSHFNGVVNLANLFLNTKIKNFIQIGSSMEYGKLKSPHKEEFKTKPLSNYAKAKVFANKFLLKFHRKYNFPVVIIRPYQVYGTHQDINRFIPIIVNSCIKNKRFNCSEGNQLRDFLYIDDFIRFIFKVLKNSKSKGEIFNIGTGHPHKIKKIINIVKKLVGKGKPDFGKIKLRSEENLITYPSIKKARKFYNWKPKTKLILGLKKTIRYYDTLKK